MAKEERVGIMRRKISRIMVVLLIAIMALGGGSMTFGFSPGFETGGINEWIKVTAPSSPFDLSTYGDQWQSNFDFSYAPYMKIYKFNVEKGQDYTLYMKMPLGQGYMNINATGISPSADDYNYVNDTINGFVMYFQQPWAPRESNIDVFRKNFKIASNSASTDLYIICSFENPNKSFEFMLKTPKDSDDDLNNSTQNPYVPDRNGYTWGGVLEVPVYLYEADVTSTQATSGEDTQDHADSAMDTSMDTSMDTAMDNAQITDGKDSSILTMGQTYMFTTSLDMDTINMKDAYIDDYATAYQLYEYQVEPGKAYTFDFMYKSFNKVNAFLIGENPMNKTLELQNEWGSNTVMAAFQSQPFSSLGYDEWYASRTQFKTSSTSTGTTLYILIRGDYAGEDYEFKLTEGYLSQEEDTFNPYADSLNGYKWVTQWKTPLKLWNQ
ncbi:hypothetical protein [Fusibacter sp. JL216-2]|uniref:hypothetical protein n=1 Tax=Fusibacter sp. JL216-2 TaxID=3071453 RepID=UPI003D33AF3A